MFADLALIFALILLNGLFAMSEIAIVSSRRVRLQQMADQGKRGAAVAMDLSAQSTRFLSTVQVGITSIGIMSGAIGEATVAGPLRAAIVTVPALTPYADTLAFVIMVGGLTYFSLIIGELVPKRFALTRPEGIANVIARPMRMLALIVRPVVVFPHPDSPTRPSVSPFLMSKVTPSTALLSEMWREIRNPAVTGK